MWTARGRASVLVGGQFGSEGKGLAAAWLAQKCERVDVATTNAGAQAGHTTRYLDGDGFVCYHLPTVGVVQKNALCYINAGSIIDPDALFKEMEACGVEKSRVRIHPRAAVITEANRTEERAVTASTTKLASTQKGVGAAISSKVMRRAVLAEQDERLAPLVGLIDLNDALNKGAVVTVEVPQGHDLSINHGLSYPYCTSRDCWVGSGLSDAGIHPHFLGEVAMVVRTFPIRVGAVYNELGHKLGESGPFYSDSQELDWPVHFPRVEPERTTVTKRVRRIASWSSAQYLRSVMLNRPDFVFLNFVNYFREFQGFGPGDTTYIPPVEMFWQLFNLMRTVERSCDVHPRHAFGVGPCVEEVIYDAARTAQWLKQ